MVNEGAVVLVLLAIALGFGIAVRVDESSAGTVIGSLEKADPADEVGERLSFAAVKGDLPELHALGFGGGLFGRSGRRRFLDVCRFGLNG